MHELAAASRTVVLMLLCWPVTTLAAQRVSGRVVDRATGEALPFAAVTIEHGGEQVARSRSDSLGFFSLSVDGLDGLEVTLAVRRIGYRPQRLGLTMAEPLDIGEIELQPAPVQLEGVTSAAARRARRLANAGFYDRATSGFGHFITEEDILDRKPRVVSDALRRVPGLTSGAVPHSIYVMRAQGRFDGRICPPKVLLDGVVVATPNSGWFNYDAALTPDAVAGIEVYRGPAELPVIFGGAQSDCGVIVIWTK